MSCNATAGNNNVTTKTKIPRIFHPLSTPGYVIIVRFLWSCLFNICVFSVTYASLAVVLPLALIVRSVKKIVVFVRVYSDRATRGADTANTGECYWFDMSLRTRSPSLILLLVVRGQLDHSIVEYLVRQRLCPSSSQETTTQQECVWRLGRSPERIFKTLLWVKCNLADKVVNEITLDVDRILSLRTRKFIIEKTLENKNWEVSFYCNPEQNVDAENVVLFQFHHCFADIYTFVQVLSRHFLDEPTFAFRGDISSVQTACLGLVAIFSSPSVLVRTIFKRKDTLFSLKPQEGESVVKRAIFYSEPVERNVVETVTTATGSSVFDVLLSCLAGSLRLSLRDNGLPFPNDVNICLQTNIRSSTSLKCFMSFNIFSLPVGTEGAIPRLWEMRLRHHNISSYVQSIAMNTMTQLAFFLLPEATARRIVRFFVAKASCNVTCILGQSSEEELVLDGRFVQTFVPIEDNGCDLSISITEYERKFHLAMLAPDVNDSRWVVDASRVCETFTRNINELSVRLAERARVVRARGERLLNSRKNSVFNVEEDE